MATTKLFQENTNRFDEIAEQLAKFQVNENNNYGYPTMPNFGHQYSSSPFPDQSIWIDYRNRFDQNSRQYPMPYQSIFERFQMQQRSIAENNSNWTTFDQYQRPIIDDAPQPPKIDNIPNRYWQQPPPTPTSPMRIFPITIALPVPNSTINRIGADQQIDNRFYSQPNSPKLSTNRCVDFFNERRYSTRSAPEQIGGGGSIDFCGFCKKNGESREYYSKHKLRDDEGRLLCPILRSYKCSICHATGDEAHTDSYCPMRPRDGRKSFSRMNLNRMATGKYRQRK